jgi:alpha-L-fucosidase 2
MATRFTYLTTREDNRLARSLNDVNVHGSVLAGIPGQRGMNMTIEHRRLVYGSPAATWDTALPIGNGSIGGMVFGGTHRERIALNHDTLWSGGPRGHGVADGPAALAAARACVRRGNYAAAGEASRGLQGSTTESYVPLGDLIVSTAPDAEGGDEDGHDTVAYRRDLDLGTAVATTRYSTGASAITRTAFASAVDGLLVVTIRSDDERPLQISASLTSPHPAQLAPADEKTVALTGRGPSRVEPEYEDVDADRGIVYRPDAGVAFAAALRAHTDGTVEARDTELVVSRATWVSLRLAVGTTFTDWRTKPDPDPASALAACLRGLDDASDFSADELRERHTADHSELFDRVTLRLGDSVGSHVPTDERLEHARKATGHVDPDLAALVFDYGRYLLIASSRPGTQAATLQGIWNDMLRPPWSSNYTTNINLQMNYWPVYTTGLPELASPLLDLIKSVSVSGERTAREVYGLPGWTAHHNVDIWASTWSVGFGHHDPVWAMWAMAGAWLCHHLVEHYDFTGDRELAAKALPILSGAAEFALGLLVEDPDGYLLTSPSTSPENTFLDTEGRKVCVDAMPTMDNWLTRELFANYLRLTRDLGTSRDLGVESADDLVERVAEALQRLLPIPVSADGTLLEWAKDRPEGEPGHRHMSHLYGLYPASLARPGAEDGFAAASRKSLEKRLDQGSGDTGWSRAWTIALWARLLDGREVGDSVDVFVRSFLAPNLFGLHPVDIFQIDGNFGFTAALAEALLQSHDGALRLLPALPPQWTSGSVTGLRARGGLTVDLAWEDGRLTSARVSSTAATTVPVAVPDRTTTYELRLGDYESAEFAAGSWLIGEGHRIRKEARSA